MSFIDVSLEVVRYEPDFDNEIDWGVVDSVNSSLSRWCRSNAAKSSIAALAATAFTVASAPVALAHDSVLSSNPADGAVLDAFPARIELVFSGEPQQNFNTIAISDADKREVLFSSQPELKNNVISLDLPTDLSPGPGNYIVGFQITSSDGHSTRGKTSFTVKDANAPASVAVTQQTGTSSSQYNENSVPTWAIGLGIGLVLLIVGVGVAVAILNRKADLKS